MVSSKNKIECYCCRKSGHTALNCKIHASDLLKGIVKESVKIVVVEELLDVNSDDDFIEDETLVLI